ncbi:MAG: sulfotransferase family protein [Hyphomicrobiaceae bacterium]
MGSTLRPPIILIGNYRSGTSITQNLIGLHPDIATWYEPRTLWLSADPSRPHDEFYRSDAKGKVASYIRKQFLLYQSRHGGRRVMEKTPSNNLRVPFVDEIFPDAIYLHITRNPFSFISSMEYKWQRPKTLKGLRRSLEATPFTQLPYYAAQFVRDHFKRRVLRQKYISMYGPRYKGIEDDLKRYSKLRVVAKQWAICNRKAREDLAKIERSRVFSFLYEDLMANPRDLFCEIYNYLKLEYNDGMLEAAQSMVDPKRQEKWNRLNRQLLRDVLPEIEDEMSHYGYDVPASLH